MTTLTISALPESHLHGVTETVADETEIPDAVGHLLALFGAEATSCTRDVFLVSDGTTDEELITVSAAVSGAVPEGALNPVTTPVTLPLIDRAAVAYFDKRPGNTAEAWIALDAALEAKGLCTTGPHRQILHLSGAVTLAAPITAASACS